jgi:non-homologous end joining protein Ku
MRLIEDLANPDVQLTRYSDEYRQRVLAAIDQKRAGGTVEATVPPVPPPTEDLMATLQQSLEARRPRAKASPAAAQPEVPEASPSKRRRAS